MPLIKRSSTFIFSLIFLFPTFALGGKFEKIRNKIEHATSVDELLDIAETIQALRDNMDKDTAHESELSYLVEQIETKTDELLTHEEESSDEIISVKPPLKKARAESKMPWQLTRSEWTSTGHPDLEIQWKFGSKTQPDCLSKNEQDEMNALNDFIGLFPDFRNAVKGGNINKGEDSSRLLDDRDHNFASTRWWVQSTSNIDTQSAFSGSQVKDNLEDARESIILGRKLGYLEQDILHYVVGIYLGPATLNLILEDADLPAELVNRYPNLKPFQFVTHSTAGASGASISDTSTPQKQSL